MILSKVTTFDDRTNQSVTTILKENEDGSLQSIELRRPRFSWEREHLHSARDREIHAQNKVSNLENV